MRISLISLFYVFLSDSQPKIISKENPAPANSKPSPENVSQHINNSCEQPPIQNTTIPDTIAAPSVLPVIKEVKSIAGLNQEESTALRRSERKIKRSIFSTYRRELRKDKKLELDMLGSDSDDELNAIIKKISPSVTAKEESSNSNRPPNNGRYVPETKVNILFLGFTFTKTPQRVCFVGPKTANKLITSYGNLKDT